MSLFLESSLSARSSSLGMLRRSCRGLLKEGNPLRPICSAKGTATYKLGKHVASLIQPAAVNCHGTDLNDTFQFVSQLRDQDLSDCILASFDVQSLFTNVPLAETIDVCMDRLYRGDPAIKPSLPEHVLRHLVSLCVCVTIHFFSTARSTAR